MISERSSVSSGNDSKEKNKRLPLPRPLLNTVFAAVNRLLDDAIRDCIEVRLKCRVQFLEFGPENVINKRGGHLHPYGCSTLTGVSVWLQAIAPQQSDEKRLRPSIR